MSASNVRRVRRMAANKPLGMGKHPEMSKMSRTNANTSESRPRNPFSFKLTSAAFMHSMTGKPSATAVKTPLNFVPAKMVEFNN